jgi:hemolysin III
MPELFRAPRLDPTHPVCSLSLAGGALYSIGAVVYGLRRPDPWPTTFGYHEIFHACTAVAAICHYIAMWFVVF